MESELKPESKKSKTQSDRISLNTLSSSRLDSWVKQVRESLPGVKINRKDLVNWLILNHSEVLSPSEERELASAHYNELRFLQFAMRELKAAKARGETVNLQTFLREIPDGQRLSAKTVGVSRRKKQKEEAAPKNPSFESVVPEPCDPIGL